MEGIGDSAGTSAWHQGEQPDQRAIEECRKHGINITDQRSRPFAPSDFDSFDLILAMDSQNFQNIRAMASSPSQMKKVRMIMDFVYPGEMKDVPDPWYGNGKGFEKVFTMLDRAADVLIDQYFQTDKLPK